MEVRNGTQVFLGFASKEEQHIELLRNLLMEHKDESYNDFLTSINENEKTGIHFDGIIQPGKLYERILPKKGAKDEDWHYTICEFNAKGMVSADLRPATVKALTRRFGSGVVKFYYFDEYRKINSDEDGIVFPRRIKVDYSVYCYPWIRTEYYVSVEELLENPMYQGHGLEDIYEMSADELSEIEDEIAGEYDDVFDIEFTVYKYGYKSLNNDPIIKFNNIFKDKE